MAEKITSEFIKSAVAEALAESFSGINLYKEPQAQGMKLPCMFIYQSETVQQNGIKNRDPIKLREYPITVRYIPDGKSGKYEKCAEIGNKLFDVLELVKTGDTLTRGNGMRYDIIDEVLHFKVSYNVRIIKKQPVPAMENLETREDIK